MSRTKLKYSIKVKNQIYSFPKKEEKKGRNGLDIGPMNSL